MGQKVDKLYRVHGGGGDVSSRADVRLTCGNWELFMCAMDLLYNIYGKITVY